jgi:hypothetical protein
VFTTCATIAWEFDGSGFEDKLKWNPGTAAAYAMTGWTPVTDGSTVPGLDLPTGEGALHTMTWRVQ